MAAAPAPKWSSPDRVHIDELPSNTLVKIHTKGDYEYWVVTTPMTKPGSNGAGDRLVVGVLISTNNPKMTPYYPPLNLFMSATVQVDRAIVLPSAITETVVEIEVLAP